MTTTYITRSKDPVTPGVTSQGDYLVVEAGGTALSATVDGGTQTVLGVASAGTVSAGGFLGINSGGRAIGTLLTGGATETVGFGGTSLRTTVQSGSSEVVSLGGSAMATVVSQGGYITVSGGYVSGLVLLSGGSAVVQGYSFSGTYSGSSGYLSISGVVSNLHVSSGGYADISAGGVLSGGEVGSGGLVIVQSTGSASSLTVDRGGAIIAEPGAIVSTRGAGSVYASGVVVTGTGSGVIDAGSVISGGTFTAGEQLFVLPGGTATGNHLSGGASEAVFSGGVVQGETIAGGFEVVSSGGFASGTVLESGAVQYVFSSGSAIGTQVESGYSIVDFGGTAISTTVSTGANQSLDGITSNTVLESGAGQYIDAGGTAISTVVEGGAYAYVFGALSGATVSGYVSVASMGVAVGDTIAPGGMLLASKGALVSGGLISSGAVMVIDDGAVDSGTMVAEGGTLIVLPGGIAGDVTVASGATEISGSAIVVISGGTSASLAGDSANGLVINSGNTAFVLSGATTTNSMISVISGATASSSTISAFGTEIVASGGSVVGAEIGPGGVLLVSSGATVSGAVSFIGSGGTLLTYETMTGSTVSNFTQGDAIIVHQGGTAVSAVLSAGNLLVIGSGASSTTIQLDPAADYSGDVFSVLTSGGMSEVTIANTASPTLSGTTTAPVDVPLYIVDVGGGEYRVGIEVSLNGGASYQMYLFDAGANGFYAAYTPANWAGYTVTNQSPAVISYAAGTMLVAQSVYTNVTLQTTSGAPLILGNTTVGLITSYSGTGTPQSWNAGLTSTPATGEFAQQYFGDFGVDLLAGREGINNLLPQIPGLDKGFIINLGSFPDEATGQIGTLQIGLTPDDITSFTSDGTLVPMQGENIANTFANTGEPSYLGMLTHGTVTFTSGTASYSEATNFVYDTGAPEITVYDSYSVISGSLSPFVDGPVTSGGSSYTVTNGTSVTLTAPGLISQSWVVDVSSAGDTAAKNLVVVNTGGNVVNVGLNAYFGESVMFDVNDGLVGFMPIACFAANTRIRTPDGEQVVEALRTGDLVMTVEGQARAIQWIGQRSLDCHRHADPASVLPVRVAAHAFAPSVPARNLYLSPDHALFLEDVLIPVKHLINGHSITQVKWPHVTYYHLELAAHDVIFAEGLPVETYLETGQRAAFADGSPVVDLHPRFAPPEACAQLFWAAAGYAPLVVSGPVLERVRKRLSTASAVETITEPLHRVG